MTLDTQHFKDLLQKELSVLEGELATVGRKNPDNLSDWEATNTEVEKDGAEEGDVAENIEEFENKRGIVDQLEIRLNEVKKALQKIEDGKYGICEVSEDQIELDRLEANPAAATCKLHMNQ